MKMIRPNEVTFAGVFSIPIKHKANGFKCVNVIIGGVRRQDISNILEPLNKNEEIVRANDDVKWCHLLKELGVFDSVTRARKSGWDKEIEFGFSEVMFKKQRKIVFVLKSEPSASQKALRWLKEKLAR